MVYWLEIKLGLKFYHYHQAHHSHAVAHLCNQFNHVFALLISMSRFKSNNNLYQTGPQTKLFLQKNCKIFDRCELCPLTPNSFRQLAAPPSYPKVQLSHCKFLALHFAGIVSTTNVNANIKIYRQSQVQTSWCMKE